MPSHLVFVTGASSGIGRALVRAVPWRSARVVDISRRGGAGVEHLRADLADPAAWPAVAAFFADAMKGFDGEGVYCIHCAGTLDPMGFAGEVDARGYARQVLLNSAAPQVVGDAFLRAARETRAPCTLLLISSGAASHAYEGWSAYCAGKAAVDHWVRTVGAEQSRRGGRIRVAAVAPGIVETAMQVRIRATAERDFPDVERFRALHAEGALKTPDEAARELWALLRAGLENGSVLDLRRP
jgi:NAD(P)-dependent dehydrogenase (short-subunit alcohol dehydrogenase family)